LLLIPLLFLAGCDARGATAGTSDPADRDAFAGATPVSRRTAEPVAAPLVPATATAQAAPPAPESEAVPVHRVQPGETLHSIADATGTSVTALVTANGLRGSRLEEGQELTIPPADARPPLPPDGPVPSAWIIDRGDTGRRSVALTFDAGADRGYAELILDVLKDHGVRASFGMTGVWASANPDLVRRMATEGHRFINHSWDHGSFTGLSPRTRPLNQAQRWSQLDRTEALIVELTGLSTRPFFRSPYGDTDASVQRDLAARGYAYNVLWTVDSGGWTGLPARSIIDRCLRSARPGVIYVLHVGASSQDGPALAAIIDGLTAAGYDFETVDEIIAP
jgi:peptidoglycan/xylan/chitin deacetylase (PgdA/CDA1 family)